MAASTSGTLTSVAAARSLAHLWITANLIEVGLRWIGKDTSQSLKGRSFVKATIRFPDGWEVSGSSIAPADFRLLCAPSRRRDVSINRASAGLLESRMVESARPGRRRVAYISSAPLRAAADRLPSNPGRSSAVHSLIESLGLLHDAQAAAHGDINSETFDLNKARAIEAVPAVVKDLTRYHDAAYVSDSKFSALEKVPMSRLQDRSPPR